MKSRKRENRKSGSVRGGEVAVHGIRIIRHIKGNLETGLRWSLNGVTSSFYSTEKNMKE